ncbi:MAG: glutamine--fructose-6-phosphate transaminase (isomerizing) [Candidatus Hydrothermarchaeales archaeon]
MCGIVGYIGYRKAAPLILDGLKRLEYRGYDSCGIATLDGKIHLKKDQGKINEINKNLDLKDLPGNVGIGHTRWATHGIPSKRNAHPHLDCKKEIAIVHNGIISNYSKLKDDLIKKGHTFRSDTDTEVIVHLIEENIDDDLENSVRETLKKVEGSYALLFMSLKEPRRIICARHESPLVLGLGNKEMFIASDISAFLKETNKAILLNDGEYAIIEKEHFKIKNLKNGDTLEREILEVDWGPEMAEKGGFEHFMLKEIYEQPQAVIDSLNVYANDIEKLADMIKEAKRTYIIGAGTSLHAALVAQYWFGKLCGVDIYALDSSELINLGVVDENTLVIGITQSGETYDTLSAMRHSKTKGAKLGAVVNVIGSTTTREADHIIMQNSGMEMAVCATKTFTSQLVILLRVAIELAKLKKKIPEEEIQKVSDELQKIPENIKKVLEKDKGIKEIAHKYCGTGNYIYIGKGITIPTAMEGALKFKEITYNHAEGMSGGLLNHGTISLIDENMTTVAIVPPEGENRSKIMSNIQEVKARGGVVIGVTCGKTIPSCDVNIVAPVCSEVMSPLLLSPVCQLLAYHTAVKLGRDVDKPRALAKSVTVE